ncbi:MAG: C-3',4' desaturase CrtD, partial [Leptolyngbya sp. SIO1D8]|nr:C-3',4' desaturase CrtD [Leptolyngbya sp. SIO1D8]
YQRRVNQLIDASGAFVVYLGVDQAAIPDSCPPHLQFLYDYDGPIGENNSLFVSVSRPGDGRAPAGKATIIASSFTELGQWHQRDDYDALKQQYTQAAIQKLGQFFDLRPEHLIHIEAGTPKTFERFTGRDRGAVGGLGMRVNTFGPFGFANRTPIPGLWLVGDCTHPGEGTAGVSYSALTAVRQIETEDRKG